MIDILDKKDCVGCNACVQRCPRQCISFSEDEQGFRYPKVNVDDCIHCNLCEKVCPVINQASPVTPCSVYAAKNNDDVIRTQSSSGGIFYALAESIINQGGVVFGARFNDRWEVEHAYAEDLAAVRPFMTSKYVQSYIGDTYRQAEEFLKNGRKVLFSGTPCQIAGLRLFLRKDYGSQLLTVDFVCHGVPSPKVWRDYLKYLIHPQDVSGQNTDFQSTLTQPIAAIAAINFRDKRLGWSKYGFSVHAVARECDQNSDFQSSKEPGEVREILFEPHYENLFMQGFLKDLYLRPSCYECPAKSGKSHSDITLADFWGIQRYYPSYYSEKCYSLLLVRSQKGQDSLNALNPISFSDATYENALKGNPSIEKSVRKPKQYTDFWSEYSINGIPAINTILTKMRPTFIDRLNWKIRAIIGKILRMVRIKK